MGGGVDGGRWCVCVVCVWCVWSVCVVCVGEWMGAGGRGARGEGRGARVGWLRGRGRLVEPQLEVRVRVRVRVRVS